MTDFIRYDEVSNQKVDHKIKLSEDLNEIRKHGFPYYVFKKDEYLDTFRRLKLLNYTDLIDIDNKRGAIILKSNSGFSSLASVFFPYMFQTPVTGKMTPMEAFYSDKLLTRSVMLCKKNYNKPTYSSLRSILKLVSGVQCVSNFRPDVAKFIYEGFAKDGRVYDFSMGYGGRLVGFLASSAREYVGVDVNKLNFEGYKEINKNYNSNKDVSWYETGSENIDTKPFKEYFDLAFSSPPYFNKEQYSKDKNQSYIKYPNYFSWIEYFLKPTLTNAYTMLKEGGVLAINIANINEGSTVWNLEEPTKMILKDLGMEFVCEIDYALAIIMGTKNRGNIHDRTDNYKFEPIFVFSKGKIDNPFQRYFDVAVKSKKSIKKFMNYLKPEEESIDRTESKKRTRSDKKLSDFF